MQKIIIDTNVLVSGLIQRSFPYFILYHIVLENLVEVCISDSLFKEYITVINRPKFAKYPDFVNKAELVLSQIEMKATKYQPDQQFNIIEDNADNRLLELAVICKADYIITGNSNDFTMNEFEGTKIVTPKDFWEYFNT